jgi:hypothetical protein
MVNANSSLPRQIQEILAPKQQQRNQVLQAEELLEQQARKPQQPKKGQLEDHLDHPDHQVLDRLVRDHLDHARALVLREEEALLQEVEVHQGAEVRQGVEVHQGVEVREVYLHLDQEVAVVVEAHQLQDLVHQALDLRVLQMENQLFHLSMIQAQLNCHPSSFLSL